ncbi:MAG: hypothetical protein HFG20_09755 [Anaerotruncus sp.]|nr:hypothetical protein [Anaerotruncus sp.]
MHKDRYRFLFDNVTHIFPTYPLALYEGRVQIQANRLPKNLEPFEPLDFPLPFNCQLRLYLPPGSTLSKAQVKCMVDSLIEMSDCRDRLINRSAYEPENKLSFLMMRLFHSAGTEGLTYIASAGLSIGYDFTLPYYVCAVRIMPPETDKHTHDYKISSLLYLIRSFYKTSVRDLVVQLTSSRLVVCRCLDAEPLGQRNRTIDYFSELNSIITSRLHVSIQVGVGCVTQGITDFSASLLQAQATLKYAVIFRSNETTNFYEDFKLEEEISHINSQHLDHFLGSYCTKLDKNAQFVELLEALVMHNMDITMAAKELFIHRNTAVYRMNQLKSELGLNPLHNDSDRFTLITIYIYYKLSQREKEHPPKKGGIS